MSSFSLDFFCGWEVAQPIIFLISSYVHCMYSVHLKQMVLWDGNTITAADICFQLWATLLNFYQSSIHLEICNVLLYSVSVKLKKMKVLRSHHHVLYTVYTTAKENDNIFFFSSIFTILFIFLISSILSKC